MDCFSCQQKNGQIKISPAEPIYIGTYWRVEHAYPSALKGWLVIILQRHAEALHELSPEEFAELHHIQAKLIPALHETTKCLKEYVAFFAEKEGFNHIHIDVIPRHQDLVDELKGPRIFSLLKVEPKDAVPPQEVIELCDDLRDKMNKES